MGTPVFMGSLTQANIDDFEDVQRSVFKIILRVNYQSYENALEVLGEPTSVCEVLRARN